MQKQLVNFIKEKKLFSLNDTVLIAVSGGIDSIVLCDLFSKSKIKFAIAHCNFKLRGKESDKDMEFVESIAEKYNVPFHFITFSTLSISKENKESIQVTARNLRYDWFEKIRKDFGYDYIATAHHQNDSIETFFINLLRGSGIKGLTGISAKNEFIVRPLLFATKNEIFTYSKKNKISYRQDSSNVSDKYLRNNIRLNLIPTLKKIKPQAENIILQSLKNLKDVEAIYYNEIENQRKKIIKKKNHSFQISIKELLKLSPTKTYLFEFIKPFGFNSSDAEQIINNINNNSGKKYISKNFNLIKDRTHLIIEKISLKTTEKPIKINKTTKTILLDNNKKIEFNILKKGTAITKTDQVANLDFNKLQFPLEIRKWEKGDKFKPLGMKGFKKLSDYFIDKKISLLDKEKIWLLTSNNKIVWIIGSRIDDRYKVTEKTNKIYFAKII